LRVYYFAHLNDIKQECSEKFKEITAGVNGSENPDIVFNGEEK